MKEKKSLLILCRRPTLYRSTNEWALPLLPRRFRIIGDILKISETELMGPSSVPNWSSKTRVATNPRTQMTLIRMLD